MPCYMVVKLSNSSAGFLIFVNRMESIGGLYKKIKAHFRLCMLSPLSEGHYRIRTWLRLPSHMTLLWYSPFP
jgi:hypothetical protein